MSRLPEADISALPGQYSEPLEVIRASNGYIPHSYMLLAHRPEILKAFMELAKVVIRDAGTIDRGFRFLVAYISSRTVGCNYCQAHNMHSADRWGVPRRKLEAIWEYETSAEFSAAEKVALRFAQCASVVPNAVDDALIENMKRYYSTAQIVEIGAVVSLFGWNHRFNDSFATSLDDTSLSWAFDFGLDEKTGWDPSEHLPEHWKRGQLDSPKPPAE